MSVVFFGATELGFACCSALIETGIEIKGIFSIPREFTIKYKSQKDSEQVTNILYKDFSILQEKYNIPVHYIEGNIKDHTKYLNDLNPTLIIVIGWYYMIPKSILAIPKLGSVAIHASLLPQYRGNAPLVWAMINGEKQTGISLFYLEGGIDEGDIIAQKSFIIDKNDTIKEVLKNAENASIEIIKEQIPKILSGIAERIPQNHTKASYYPKRSPQDGEIDWDWDTEKINQFIKAQTYPYPGAFTYINDKKVIIWKATIQNKK